MYGFGYIAIFRFWQFGWKMPIDAHFGWFFEAHFREMMSLIVLTPKGTVLGPNHVI